MPNTEKELVFSVVIPTYQRPETLAMTLDRINPATAGPLPFTYEVIVSDDSTDDQTRLMIESKFPWVRWIPGPQKGPAANRNHGANQSHAKWLVFTDDDCLPEPGWLMAYFKNIEVALVLEGKTIADREKQRFDEESPINLEGSRLWSCNFAVQRSLFVSMGGFDESFTYASMEDMDFQKRCIKAIVNPTFVPEATVVHPWRLRKGSSFISRQAKAALLYAQKHPEFAFEFGARFQLLALLRFTIKGILFEGGKYRYKGFINEFLLRLQYAVEVSRVTRKLRRQI